MLKEGYPMKWKGPLFVLLAAFVMAVTACNHIMPATNISTIMTNPRDYADKEVTLSGTVTDAYSFVLVKYFLINDGTGSIPVISQGVLPVKGTSIKVTGTVQEAFSLGDQSMMVLLEKQASEK
jgi:hypothetical protein